MTIIGLELNVDVTKIDKSKIYAGKKGKYLKLTTFVNIDEKDQYDNNGFITQSITKEEQNNGVKGVILGNCKVFWKDGQKQMSDDPDINHEIPF